MSVVPGVGALEQVSHTLEIFGCLRNPLLGQQRAEFVKATEEQAVTCGGLLCEAGCESASSVAMFWALLQDVDRDRGGDMMSAVTNHAWAEPVAFEPATPRRPA